MGKRRNTAKTGDKGLYKSREENGTSNSKKDEDDDNMYNEIDRFHNAKDEEFLKLDQQPEDDDDMEDGFADKEAVMDLAGGSSSSSSSEDESDEDDDKEEVDENDAESEEVDMSSDDDDDDDLEMDEEAVTDWGRRKASYHGGDTADLEIGQNEEDAYLEEEAAKEVLAARYEQMDEDDFVLSEDEGGDKDVQSSKMKDVQSVQSARDLKKLSRKAKRKLLESHHPELIPLVGHFSEVIQDWNDRTRVVADALFSSKDVSPEDIGATKKGLEYLTTKALIQSSTALNVAAYLLLKAEQASKEKDESDLLLDGDAGSEIKSHPVMTRLQQLNKLSMKLEDNVEAKVPTILNQLDSLVKAASLMKDEAIDESDEESADSEEASDDAGQGVEEVTPVSSAPASEDREGNTEQQEIAQEILNDARFGLRPQEVKASSKKPSKKLQRRTAPVADFGDEEKDEARSRQASQSLATTINSIQQRSAVKSRKPKRIDEALDNQEDYDLRRGLAMMEAELGPLDGDEDDGEVDDELNDGLEEEGGFYDKIKKKAQARKEFKKQLYAVAPKHPRMEVEVEGERPITTQILKNRGLVPHKPKINRNPRVKKREQYRKAIIKRKGKVREVRTDEGHKYGGEQTGIKTGLSRSRKLVS